jgi:hypothetical protein
LFSFSLAQRASVPTASAPTLQIKKEKALRLQVQAPNSELSITGKRTTSSNSIAISNASKQAKPQTAKMELEDEDESHEEEAALASPIKGSESRKINNVGNYFIFSLTNAN